jgi:3-oxoacyl-(acyl-carrier-protein) synthase III
MIGAAQGVRIGITGLGVNVPEKIVTNDELAELVETSDEWIRERTGIRERRIAEDDEALTDIALPAARAALEDAGVAAEDIDLLICGNISRYDSPDSRFTVEPSTSLLLKRHFGFRHAIAFDVLNACAGVFTALYLADALITRGVVARAMVVSGEYITHLTRAAQAVIDGFSDPRLACLTLGDAGIAFVLEPSSRDGVGFHGIDLFTLGRYSSHCVASLTPGGDWTMQTQVRELAAAAFGPTLASTLQSLSRADRDRKHPVHVIPHQTSSRHLNRGAQAINQGLAGSSTTASLINNVAERGNTASTSHFVAVHDHVLNGTIRSGDQVMFAVSASGVTVGSALYTFDDLPDRLRSSPAPAATSALRPRFRRTPMPGPRVRIESVGVLPLPTERPGSSLALSCRAAERSLAGSTHPRNAIDLIIYAGVYRTDFVYEPAIASMVAGELGINDTFESLNGARTLAFDVFNSSVGFLNACFLAAQLIQERKSRAALVVTSEVENPSLFRGGRRGVTETASALILDQSPGRTGFGGFLFRSFTDYIDLLTCSVSNGAAGGGEGGGASLSVVRDPTLEARYVECVRRVVPELVAMEGLDLSEVALFIPPPLSRESIDKLSEQLKVDRDRFVQVTGSGEDLFTSSVPYALDAVRCRGLAQPGDIGVIISAGAGIEVGCAIYYF